jgi:hypothetical protein
MEQNRNKRAEKREEIPTSAPTSPADFPLRRAPLPEDIRRQIGRWAIEQDTDSKAAKQIGISTSALVCARAGRTMSQRVQWKIMQFFKKIEIETPDQEAEAGKINAG